MAIHHDRLRFGIASCTDRLAVQAALDTIGRDAQLNTGVVCFDDLLVDCLALKA